jgi:hypothetical protein
LTPYKSITFDVGVGLEIPIGLTVWFAYYTEGCKQRAKYIDYLGMEVDGNGTASVDISHLSKQKLINARALIFSPGNEYNHSVHVKNLLRNHTTTLVPYIVTLRIKS